jgi:hypothetical protein
VRAAVGADGRRRRSSPVVAGLAFLLSLASVVLGVAVLVLEARNGQPVVELSSVVGLTLLAVTLPLVGRVVAAKRPRNPLGWILCAIGVF